MMRCAAVLLAAGLGASIAAANGDHFAFMPDGGPGLLAAAFPTPAEQRDALSRSRTEEEWRTLLETGALSPREGATLAAYLARIAPRDVPPGDPLGALPADGRSLALTHCQSCHSLFTGYLMQRRDRNGWLAVFASPFHKDIPMSAAEREIFADYSAINMPMRVEDVPPELRF